MSEVTVSILGKDQIVIGYDISDRIVNDILEQLPSSTYVLITDTNIAKHDHVKKLSAQFESKLDGASQRLLQFRVSPGEMSKSRATKARVEDFMLEQRCTRDTVVLAVGGGVIGDMIGYVAATFMRGVRYVQIPTTLLAMVDSSIGGKTAIDVPSGKNLVGSFWQPSLNFIELRFLETLPRREFLNGMAEVVKTAAIWNAAEFDRLERVNPAFMAAMAAPRDYLGRVDLSPIKQELLDTVHGSVKVKAEVVTLDEREGGLRNLLNFGHSIGHAYEALLTPHILHGECVAIGSVLEAELSRFLGHLSAAAVARLISCFKAYELPVSWKDPIVRQRSRNVALPVEKLLEIMAVDKKNSGKAKRIVLLSKIGKTLEPNATVVSDDIIRLILSENVGVHGLQTAAKPSVTVTPPGSKSISNRVLVLCALAKGRCRISNLLHSDDTGFMLEALQKLNAADVGLADHGDTLVVTGKGGKGLKSPDSQLYLGNAGTAARFLTAVAALVPGKVELTGNKRMQERPIGALVDALRNNATKINYLKKEGSLPLSVEGTEIAQLKGGRIELAATVSSQYVSALLMVAPYASSPVTLSLVGGKPISQFYIDMTIRMMADFGIKVEASQTEPYTYHIPRGTYQSPAKYIVESDASSATYPLAFAALTGTECVVPTIGSASLQGDAKFATDVLLRMGCEVDQTSTSTTVRGPKNGHRLRGIDVDMEPMTDAFLTACIVAAVAEGRTRIKGIANQHVKECDRIKAMHDQLQKFGVETVEGEDGIDIVGIKRQDLKLPPSIIHSYDDHRVAMSLSLLASQVTGTTEIDDRRCVEKTWPGWWDTLYTKLGVSLEGRSPSISEGPSTTSSTNDNSIVLVGMRGAGKTSLGLAAASALGMRFADIDHELERQLKIDIRELINTKGWDVFRDLEANFLETFLSEHPKGHVVACGGGIVELPRARETLKKFSATGQVVHVHRNLNAIISMLEKDKSRPQFSESIESVYRRREPLYSEVSNRLYWQPPVHDHSQLRASLVSFFEGSNEIDFTKRSFFLSLTFPNLLELPEETKLEEIFEGCDAVELRVDLLESWERDFVAEQVGVLRLQTGLPIIFTVRTQSQGGKYHDDDWKGYNDLVKLAFDLNVEFVDIELTAEKSHDLVRSLRKVERTKVIASHHDPKGLWKWDSLEWRAAFFDANRLGDIVKFVGFAKDFGDNSLLEEFRAEIKPSKTPFIGINMGPVGQMSRVLNRILTPVTHPSLPSAAAPGQLSVAQCNRILSDLGGILSKSFFVCGNPIGHSQSPNLHNGCFSALCLPHRYSKFETSDPGSLKAHIDKLGSSFGGASVTIPLKESVIPLCARLSEDARVIGAVNTLTPTDNGDIVGSNTDWIGIRNSFRMKGVATGTSALVVGAGGTALAAIYAFYRMGFKRVYVLNRTVAKAESIAARFRDLVAVEVLRPGTNATGVTAVLSCVPGDKELPSEMTSQLEALLKENSGVLVEAAYKPKHTPVMKLAESYNWITVPGRQMLVFQGVEQFSLWNGFYPLLTAERCVEE